MKKVIKYLSEDNVVYDTEQEAELGDVRMKLRVLLEQKCYRGMGVEAVNELLLENVDAIAPLLQKIKDLRLAIKNHYQSLS